MEQKIKNLLIYGELRLEEFKNLNPEKTLFLLQISPLEVHGTHLPMDTDMISVSLMAHSSAAAFLTSYTDWTVVLMPMIPAGAATIPYPGSINMRRETVFRIVTDYINELSKWGMRNIVILNGHGGLSHNLALDDACRKGNRKKGMRVISPGVMFLKEYVYGERFPELEAALGRNLTEDEKKGLVAIEHGGGWETSMVLLGKPELVKGNYIELKPKYVELNSLEKKFEKVLQRVLNFFPVFRSFFIKYRGSAKDLLFALKTKRYLYDGKNEMTYSGTPAVASTEIGAAWQKVFSELLCNLYNDVFIEKTKAPNEVHSPFSHFYFFNREFLNILKYGLVAILVLYFYFN